jgi:HEAT repeat protein
MNAPFFLRFLRANQPLPSDLDPVRERGLDAALTEISRFDGPLEGLAELLIGALGSWEDGAYYENVKYALQRCPRPEVIASVAARLADADASRRIGACEIAFYFPDASYVPALAKLVEDPEPLARQLAAAVLIEINGPRAYRVVREAMRRETHPEVLEIMNDFIDQMGL